MFITWFITTRRTNGIRLLKIRIYSPVVTFTLAVRRLLLKATQHPPQSQKP